MKMVGAMCHYWRAWECTRFKRQQQKLLLFIIMLIDNSFNIQQVIMAYNNTVIMSLPR